MSSLNENLDLSELGGETLPFLENEEKTESVVGEGVKEPQPRRISRIGIKGHPLKYGFVHVVIFLLYTIPFIMSTKRKTVCMHNPTWYSPAQEAEQYELRPVDGLAEGSEYAGYPSPESDAAWGALVEGINLKIYPDEMSRLGQTSLEMKDGSGYLAALGVYHELHCIKRLRKWFYQSYYYPNQTEIEYNERMTHAEHCLEFIRQAAMCHGDTTITSFKWLHDAQGRVVEPTTKEGALHRCVKWDRLSSWAKSRRVDLYDEDWLIQEDEADGTKE